MDDGNEQGKALGVTVTETPDIVAENVMTDEEFVTYTCYDDELSIAMDKAFDHQIAVDEAQAQEDRAYFGAAKGLAGSTMSQQSAYNDAWRDGQLREKALEAALRTDNPSRDELVKTAEALYAFLKGDAK